MTKQDLKKEVDGNSLDEIAKFLDVEFGEKCYKHFERLRSYPEYSKVIGIMTPSSYMKEHCIWLYGLYDTEDGARWKARSMTAGFSRTDIKIIYCAYDKNGNYLGGLEPYLRN